MKISCPSGGGGALRRALALDVIHYTWCETQIKIFSSGWWRPRCNGRPWSRLNLGLLTLKRKLSSK